MATTVTIDLPAEDLRWPKRCICCSNVDETDVEVIVPDTVDANRPIEEVITADVPHCLECRQHMGMGIGLMRTLAFVVVLCLMAAFGMTTGHGEAVVAAGIIVLAVVIALDQINIRRHMRQGCAAAKQAYKFVHPCGREITTILFLNDSFAREFRALNGRGTYEP